MPERTNAPRIAPEPPNSDTSGSADQPVLPPIHGDNNIDELMALRKLRLPVSDTVRWYCRIHRWVDVRWHNPAIQFRREHNQTSGCLPVLETGGEAIELMRTLVRSGCPWVSVFWDRGWGDSGQIAEISIIEDGDGQNPRALITKDVYEELRQTGVIEPNSLHTYKARRVHDFAEQAAAQRAQLAAQS